MFPNLPNIIKPPKSLTKHFSCIHRHVGIKPCAKFSNMLKRLNGAVTTLIEAMVALDSCCHEPMIRNCVFESLNINLYETNH